MNCKATLEMLSAYLDRELANPERDAIRSHLADCEKCRVEERDLRALKGLLLGVRSPEPAADFEHRLMSRLRAEAEAPVRRRFEFPPLRPLAWGQLGGLAAAAAMATFVVLHTPTAMSPEEPVRPDRHETVAQHDYEPYAERYEAYARPDDFTAGSALLASNSTTYGP